MVSKAERALSVIEWGVASRPYPRRAVSGDAYVVKAFARGILLAVVDGLGRGDEAAMAARTAVTVLEKYASGTVVSLIKRCHRSLMMTRGAVMTLASMDTRANIEWLGIGNVEGLLLRADTVAVPSFERLSLQGGVVGYQLPVLKAHKTTLQPGDMLVLATDGITGDFTADARGDEPAQRIANRVLRRHFKGNDDALVLVVRHRGGGHE